MATPERHSRDRELHAIIRPMTEPVYEVDSFWHMAPKQLDDLAEGYGGIDMVPDYQRGHVWTTQQQEGYIEAAMRGTLPSSGRLLQFNCPNWHLDGTATDLPDGLQCLDGLQRYTAVQRLLAGELRPFGLPLARFRGTSYDPKRFRFRIAVFHYTSRHEVLQHYLALNAGGTPHSDDELRRVRGLLMACHARVE